MCIPCVHEHRYNIVHTLQPTYNPGENYNTNGCKANVVNAGTTLTWASSTLTAGLSFQCNAGRCQAGCLGCAGAVDDRWQLAVEKLAWECS